ncbi:hypothetical protein CA54_17080 [Symmachiella macrocystis]|uniref:Uncharacterized protein n=1 Tax=Symmachiella macrocystis TaxID=2527985 RepID=A0A5C6BM74_9PLAN|nr:hypothetical protein CA54_17080 [Symmachiella macrocystis]
MSCRLRLIGVAGAERWQKNGGGWVFFGPPNTKPDPQLFFVGTPYISPASLDAELRAYAGKGFAVFPAVGNLDEALTGDMNLLFVDLLST